MGITRENVPRHSPGPNRLNRTSIPRWTTWVPAYALIAAGVPLRIYEALGDVVGVSTGLVYVVAQLPALFAGLRLLRLLAPDRLIGLLLVAVGLSGLSLAWSGVDVAPYGVEVFLGLVLVLAWSVIVAVDPDAIRRLAWTGFVIVLVSLPVAVLNLFSAESAQVPFAVQYPHLSHPVGVYGEWIPTYTVVSVALFSRMLWDAARGSSGGRFATLFYLACLGLLAASSYRSVTLGAAAALAYWGMKGRGLARLAGVALCAVLLVGIPLALAGTYTSASEQSSTDILARYQSIGADQLSGRLITWEATIDELRQDPAQMLVGVGLSAAPRYVTRANSSSLKDAAEGTILSSDNTLLEMWLAMGIVGLALAVAIAVMVVRRLLAQTDPAKWALWIALGALMMTSIPAYGYASGGVILVGLGFGCLLRRRSSSVDMAFHGPARNDTTVRRRSSPMPTVDP